MLFRSTTQKSSKINFSSIERKTQQYLHIEKMKY